MNFTLTFEIAGISISFESDFEPIVSSNLARFSDKPEPKYKIRCMCEDIYADNIDKAVRLNDKTDVVITGNGLVKYYRLAPSEPIYAASFFNPKDKIVDVRYLSDKKDIMKHIENSFFCSSIEDILLERNRFFFHACCIGTELGAVLFSGDSGIGKSTQGALWRKYGASEIISDDRPIIGREADGWYAFSSPINGKSVSYGNYSSEIATLVFLGQERENRITEISKKTAFKEIVRQSAFAFCEKEQINRMFDLIGDFCEKVRILKYDCLPDKSAFDYLQRYFEEVGND